MMRPRCPFHRSALSSTAGVLVLVGFLLAGPGQSALGGPVVTVASGSFSGPNPFAVDEGFVTEYKLSTAGIADGSLASRSRFLPGELSIPIENDLEGGSSYHVSIFDGLQMDDIVLTREDWRFRFSSSEDWDSLGTEIQGVRIGPYTHSESQTIGNFRDFIEETPEGGFRFVKGTGLFWDVYPDENIVGLELQVVRTFEVIRGGQLLWEDDDGVQGPLVNSRGLTVGNVVTGGMHVTLSDGFTGEETTGFVGTAVAVPEPGTIAMVSLGALMIGGVAAIRRRPGATAASGLTRGAAPGPRGRGRG